MATKEKILASIWAEHNTKTDTETVLDTDFVENVIYPAMEKYSKEQAGNISTMGDFYSMFKGGFTIKVIPYPIATIGEGLLLIHPDNMPKK